MSASRPPRALDRAFETPAAKRQYVQRLFGVIADRYDLITRLLSFGLDQRWKRRLMGLAGIQPGMRVLDLACGTGDLSALAAARGARVTGLDFARRMIELARLRSTDTPVQWMVADMGALPLRPDVFACVTTGYGLRNVPDIGASMREIHRVLSEHGVFCSLDFNRPGNAIVRGIYLLYLTVVGATLGMLLHRDPDTYRYIPASIRRYPGAAGVAAMLREAGFRDVRHLRVLGGFMAIHVARK